jgi:ribosomal protein L29
MTKGTKAKEYRSKNSEELNAELRKLREELQNIKFSKVSGTAVQKLSKIKVKYNHNNRSSESKSPEF